MVSHVVGGRLLSGAGGIGRAAVQGGVVISPAADHLSAKDARKSTDRARTAYFDEMLFRPYLKELEFRAQSREAGMRS